MAFGSGEKTLRTRVPVSGPEPPGERSVATASTAIAAVAPPTSQGLRNQADSANQRGLEFPAAAAGS